MTASTLDVHADPATLSLSGDHVIGIIYVTLDGRIFTRAPAELDFMEGPCTIRVERRSRSSARVVLVDAGVDVASGDVELDAMIDSLLTCCSTVVAALAAEMCALEDRDLFGWHRDGTSVVLELRYRSARIERRTAAAPRGRRVCP